MEFKEINNLSEQHEYKVLCRCFTYNQASYIEDALNGFAIQQTSFPFVCLVIDDCSTDGEQDVIKAWIDRECDMDRAEYVVIEPSHIILVPHKTNKSCSFAFYLLKQNLNKDPQKKHSLIKPWRDRCEYEALCEGDDYWIDPLKLQKQVDYMDKHLDCALCFSNVSVYDESNSVFIPDNVSINAKQKTTISDIAQWNYIHTPSVLYRRDDTINKKFSLLGPVALGDYPTWILYAEKGYLYKFEEQMVVYRQGSGIWSTQPFIYRLVKTLVMLCKLRMVLESQEAIIEIDKQISNYQQIALNEYATISKELENKNKKVCSVFSKIRHVFSSSLRLSK